MGPFSSGFPTQHNMPVKMTRNMIDHSRREPRYQIHSRWSAMSQHIKKDFAADEECMGSLDITGSSPAYCQAHPDHGEVDQQNDPEVMDYFNDALAATSTLERFLVSDHPQKDMVCISSHTFGPLTEDSVGVFRDTEEPQMRDSPEERCDSSAHHLSGLQSGSARACSSFLETEHLTEEPY